jgi:hypothetical protein
MVKKGFDVCGQVNHYKSTDCNINDKVSKNSFWNSLSGLVERRYENSRFHEDIVCNLVSKLTNGTLRNRSVRTFLNPNIHQSERFFMYLLSLEY